VLNSPFFQYRRAQAETADPGELVAMLYRGGIRFLQRALLALKESDYQTANANLIRAEDVLSELNTTLNPSAGDLAVNLARIYDYAYWRLVEANCRKDALIVEEVLGILQDLLPAWEEAVRRIRQARLAGIAPSYAISGTGSAAG